MRPCCAQWSRRRASWGRGGRWRGWGWPMQRRATTWPIGDVALIALAAGQFHLGLMGQSTFVHAHAGLRRVVETPVDDGLSDAMFWRLGRG
jgi:hypothetical protein